MTLKKLNKRRYIKSLIVGGIGVIPNYIIYMMMRDIWIYYVNLGWFLGIVAGATFNYIFNEVWTFAD